MVMRAFQEEIRETKADERDSKVHGFAPEGDPVFYVVVW